MNGYLKVNGTWQSLKSVQLRVGGVWRKPKKLWIKRAGVWLQITNSLEPVFSSFESSRFRIVASVVFGSDGSVVADSGGPGWLTDIAANNGSGFWIRLSNADGRSDISRGSFNTWLPMTSALTVSFQSPHTDISSGEYEVSSDGGASILGVGTWDLAVDW